MTEITRPMAAREPRGASDAGIALVVSLLLMVAMSMIGAGLLMVSKTETYASMNYRMMSQARYGAESGVMRAANYLTQTYVTPGSVGDPMSNYNTAVSPVTYNGQPVILSADPNKAANYPIGSVQTAFSAAVQGTLNAQATVAYNAYATLVSMREVFEYGKGMPTIIQTWHITGTGSIAGGRPATVEVSSVLERNYGSAASFAVFATAVQCGSIAVGGGAIGDSYDSSSMTMDADGQPITQLTGSKMGTNGNLSAQGNATVYGTLSTPRTGVGSCKSGAITALSATGQAGVTEGLIQLPQAITFPPPDPPSPMPPTNSVNMSGACNDIGYTAPVCTGSPGDLTFNPAGGTMALGNVTLNSGKTLRLRSGTYNINSIVVGGGGKLIIEQGPVVFKMGGAGATTIVNFQGGIVENPSFKPTDFQILYGGIGSVTVAGGASAAMMVYSPNANVSVVGGADFYGALIGATVDNSGGTAIHYDRDMGDKFFIAGNYVMSAFTWRKY
jgi:Tfp pilus assembly protein PilX